MKQAASWDYCPKGAGGAFYAAEQIHVSRVISLFNLLMFKVEPQCANHAHV